MTTLAPISDDDMYTMWVACHRNAADAARKLGMEPAAFRYHVRTKGFANRYAAEYMDAAEGNRRAALVEALDDYRDMMKILVTIAKDTEEETKDRIMAIREFMHAVNVGMPRAAKESPGPQYLDTHGVVVMPSDDPEVAVRMALEANVIEAHESRTRRKS